MSLDSKIQDWQFTPFEIMSSKNTQDLFLNFFKFYLYNSPILVSNCSSCENKSCFSVQTLNSWSSSGTIRKVLHPLIFLDFKMSPNIWSPTYRTSLSITPIMSENTSTDPEKYKQNHHNVSKHFHRPWKIHKKSPLCQKTLPWTLNNTKQPP